MKLSFLLLAALVTGTARAAIISITPETELRLGDGVEPLTEQHFNSCVNFDVNDVYAEDSNAKIKNPSTRHMNLSLDLITSYSDFDRYMNVSVSASMKAMSGGGSFSLNQESRNTLHSDQAALGITSHADYGRWYLKNVTLKPEYKKLSEEDREKFYELCGKEYVAGYTLGQGVKVLLTTSQNSAYSYDRLRASIAASYNGGATSGKMSADFENVTRELIKNGMLKINFVAYGSGEMKAGEALIRDQADIKAYRDKIADIVKAIEGKQAMKIAYLTRPYESLEGTYDPIFASLQKQTIELLFASYRRLFDTRARLSNIMGPQFASFAERECVADYKTYCEDYVAAMQKSRDYVEESIRLIEKLSQECIKAKEGKQCRLPRAEEVNMDVLNRIQWPLQFKHAMYTQMLRDIRDRSVEQPDKKP